jgi:hypothetical protein
VAPDDLITVVDVDPSLEYDSCGFCDNKPYILIEINGWPKVLCDECLDEIPALRLLEYNRLAD